jgi:hypothetical protein
MSQKSWLIWQMSGGSVSRPFDPKEAGSSVTNDTAKGIVF